MIIDRTLEGHESARGRGKSTGGFSVVDETMLAMALHLRASKYVRSSNPVRSSRSTICSPGSRAWA
ncbi:hypothetical protein [Nocardia uniformis]|uniref:hypothetical protein n=1 Tax=Nocardia uniformis TaxID=53432 RepID=UPI00083729AE|nr:hypothetical protein [Nocardia uniformis]